jgi:hypothetical protein
MRLAVGFSILRYSLYLKRTDPHGYDLVLNTGRLSVRGCAEVIEKTLHRFLADTQAPVPRPPTAAVAPAGAR